MGKRTQRTIWLDFMDDMRWDDISVWKDMSEYRQNESLPLCRQWVEDHLHLISTHDSGSAKDRFIKYYFKNQPLDVTHGDYIYRDRAVWAMIAAYQYERELKHVR